MTRFFQDPMLDLEEPLADDSSQASYTPGLEAVFSDPRLPSEISHLASDAVTDDEDDEWLEDLVHSRDQTNHDVYDQAFSLSRPTAFQLTEAVTVFSDLNLAHNLRPSAHLSGSGCSTPSYLLPQTQSFGPCFQEAAGNWTSHFHALLDDDLQPDEAGNSETCLVAHSQAAASTGPDSPCAKII